MTDSAAKPGAEAPHAFRQSPFRQQQVLRYGLAPLAVAVAFVVRLLHAPMLGDASPYLRFVPAVLVAAGLGGLGPGLLATALSVLVGSLVTMSSAGPSGPEIAAAALFTLIGVGIAWSGEQLQRNRIRAASIAR